jgi:hypothetical protein
MHDGSDHETAVRFVVCVIKGAVYPVQEATILLSVQLVPANLEKQMDK